MEEAGGGGDISEAEGDGYTTIYTASSGRSYKEYKQTRGWYTSIPYGTGVISNSGCGPTAIAIAISGLGVGKDPGQLVNETSERHTVSGSKVTPTFTRYVLETSGVSFTMHYSLSESQIRSHLQSGYPIVLSVNSNCGQIFTKRFHYIALLDINGDQVYVSNPNPDTANGWIDIDIVLTCTQGRAGFLISN